MYALFAEDFALEFLAKYASQLEIAIEITALYFAAVSGILMTIVFWKLFKKAGDRGWKCLIPVYNVYNQFRVAWRPDKFFLFAFWFLLFFASSFVMFTFYKSYGFLTATPSQMAVEVGTAALAVACILALLLMSVRLMIHFATAYGRERRFAWGLALFPIAFFLILAFGKHRYAGPQD